MGIYGNPYHFVPNYNDLCRFSKVKNEIFINEFKRKHHLFPWQEKMSFSLVYLF